jgi:hypothetical protein
VITYKYNSIYFVTITIYHACRLKQKQRDAASTECEHTTDRKKNHP